MSNVLGVVGSMLMAILGSTFLGHICCNWAAYCLFNVGSTGVWILLENLSQWENPRVCAPVKYEKENKHVHRGNKMWILQKYELSGSVFVVLFTCWLLLQD